VSETPAATPAPKKGKKNLLVIGLAAVVVLGGIGGGAFWWTNRAHAAEPAPATAEAVEAEHGIVLFEPFVVNLADANASRFLRVKIQLVVGTVEQGEAMTKSPVASSRARSTILELLTTQTADVLVTPDGKAALRKTIAEEVAKAAGHVDIVDVLFSDFVVQF
jgi:flagellar FliL protein